MSKKAALIIAVNLGDFGSTGNMMIGCLEYAASHGAYEYLVMTPGKTSRAPSVPFGEKRPSLIERAIVHYLSKFGWFIDGDFYTRRAKTIIRTIQSKIKEGRKVIVHLHNIHHASIDAHYLLRKLSRMDLHILYTLHDCWSFTGGCYHYESTKCDGFTSGCSNCPLKYKLSHWRLGRKTKPLVKAKNALLLPCSKWLSDELEKSALHKLPKKVVYGETPLVPQKRDLSRRRFLGLSDQNRVLISVAKGVEHLIRLAKVLPPNYKLIIVGGAKDGEWPSNVISTGHVDLTTFASYLALSDCFVSCTPEETLGLVIPEAQMSGLPVVGFGHGGSAEAITPKTGIMVGCDDNIQKLLEAIIYVVEKRPFETSDIIANGKRFAKGEYGRRMLEIYDEMSD